MNPDEPGWVWSTDRHESLMAEAARIASGILDSAAAGPVTRPIPAEELSAFATEPAVEAGIGEDAVLADITSRITPYPFGNGSPRFLAWVNSPPHPVGVAASLIASAMDPSVAGGRHAAVHVEHEVIRWVLDLLGWSRGTGAHGLLTSGGSAAALLGLQTARQRAYASAGIDVRRRGTAGITPRIYATAEAHSCIIKAVEALGLGSDSIRTVAVDDDDRMIPAELNELIASDRSEGRVPVAVVASAGTVNTGAIDPLSSIADVCADHDVWLHVDGAYGGPAVLLLPEFAEAAEGLARADSVGIDAHKWLYAPTDVGMVLFRDGRIARETFSLVPSYLQSEPTPDEPVWFSEYGLEQTRSFRALKLWAQIRHLGWGGYRELIGRDIAVAAHLAERIAGESDFELCSTGLSVVCFRYLPAGLREGDADVFQVNLATRLQTGGEAFLAPSTLRGRKVLRACIVNPGTTAADIDAVIDLIRATGDSMPR